MNSHSTTVHPQFEVLFVPQSLITPAALIIVAHDHLVLSSSGVVLEMTLHHTATAAYTIRTGNMVWSRLAIGGMLHHLRPYHDVLVATAVADRGILLALATDRIGVEYSFICSSSSLLSNLLHVVPDDGADSVTEQIVSAIESVGS